MPRPKKRVLTVGLSAKEFQLVAPCLDGERFEIDRFPGALGALELIACQVMDVLLVRYPLPGMELAAFLTTVRGKASPCRHSPVLLLTTRRNAANAESSIGRGANRVVALDGGISQLQTAVSDLLGVAPRKSCRFIAQLKIHNGRHGDWILCRTRNGSTSGILLETDQRVPRGTKVDFELTSPTIARPIAGQAEVTRHTVEGRDPVRGMGMRFLSFDSGSRQPYEEFLKRRRATRGQ